MNNPSYICEVKNYFSVDFCNSIIKKYDDLVISEMKKINDLSICNSPGACPNCDCLRVNLMQHEVFKAEVDFVSNELFKLVEIYKTEFKIEPIQFPKQFGFESLKIKRYLPNSYDGMKPHIDVTDSTYGKRFLAFVIYLNENFLGGETIFQKHSKSFKPSTGTVLMFPPYWPWLHSAEKVTGSSSKYFLGSYLHYVT